MSKTMEKFDVSTRSSKAEILEAYESMRKKMEEMSEAKPATEKAQQIIKIEEKKVVEKASSYTVEKIVKDIADLNIYMGKALNELSEKLTVEAAKLHDIRSAIEIENKHLEEVRDIKIAADTLALLIQEYDEKKKQFEKETAEREDIFKKAMQEKQDEWKREQQQHDLEIKERDAKLTKERLREKEEFEYNLALARKKDKDDYQQKKTVLERELTETREKQEREFTQREAVLREREQELAELRKRVDSFDAMMKEAVKQAEKEATARAEQKADITAKLFAKEKEGEIKLLELKNKNLEELVEKQISQIEDLTKQLQGANSQVLSIATKAIEGASGAKTLTTIQEIAMEQARQPKLQK